MTKQCRLLKDHPYAAAGTLVTVTTGIRCMGGVSQVKIPNGNGGFWTTVMPFAAEKEWLIDVEEEPMCSPEFAEAFKKVLRKYFGIDDVRNTDSLLTWLDCHTDKPKQV